MSTVDANIARAAKILSVRPGDVASADVAPAGLVIRTVDGVAYVVVPDDQPDADGKVGLMFLVKPNPDRTYSFPVYTSPDDGDPDVGDADGITEPAPAPVVEPPPRSGRGSGEKAWRKFAGDHDVDLAGANTRDDVIAACEDAGLIEVDDG